jgi:hypothetical protein
MIMWTTIALGLISGLTLLFTILIYRYMKKRDAFSVRVAQPDSDRKNSAIYKTIDGRTIAAICFTVENDMIIPLRVTSLTLGGCPIGYDRAQTFGSKDNFLVADGTDRGKSLPIPSHFPIWPALPAKVEAKDKQIFWAWFNMTESLRELRQTESLKLQIEIDREHRVSSIVEANLYTG